MKRGFFFVCLCIGFGFPLSPQAKGATIEKKEVLLNHLKITGYETAVRDAETVKVTSKSAPGFLLRGTTGGLLAQTAFSRKAESKLAEDQFHSFLNSLNAKAVLCRYYSDIDGDLLIEATYLGDYEQHTFTLFLNGWQKDMSRLVEHPDVLTHIH